MSVDTIILVICGSILALSTILVIQDYFSYYIVKIFLFHPSDYIAHFVTCFAGVLFFSVLLNMLDCSRESILIAPVVIMLAASLFKEFVIDPTPDFMDMLSNLLGILIASMVLYKG